MEGLGFGIAAFAFWAFIAACVVSGIWYAIREKEAQHETLRRIIESGKEFDADVIEKVMSDGGKSETDLKVAGLITMSVAPGLALLGWVIQGASGNDQIFKILSGVGGLVFFIAMGLLFAARVVERSNARDSNKTAI